MNNEMYTPPERKVDIFKKNDDKYNTYSDCKLEYFEPINFRKANFDYLTSNNHLYATWNYGDTFKLSFDLTRFEDYIQLRKLPVSASNIKVTFYNFRYEQVYTTDVEPADEISVIIDSELSTNTFKRGTYFCEIKLFVYINDMDSVTTLIPAELCMLNVK